MNENASILQGQLLWIDAAGPEVQVGLLHHGSWQFHDCRPQEALKAIPELTTAALTAANTTLAQLDGFVYGCGPGSTLGLRLAAMMLRTWKSLPEIAPKPIFQYGSLEATAAVLRPRHPGDTLHILAPWQKKRCHHLQINADGQSERNTLDPTSLPTLQPERSVYWIPMRSAAFFPAPSGVNQIDYSIQNLPAAVENLSDFLTLTEQPRPEQVAAPEYAAWSGERHRAPSVR